ncbi:GDP-L-fucose synthase [Candidatus Methylopumilus planktonicus]|uniref:GDP-L-fucose synthase family protein n=1 Tax=Candidatus Methylopumilus planktonicus TaxID=1581557 RepID=UPI0011224CBB|nr:GDP-L-fucose synthase [Candidatus Methylopumilus planktonicus]QDD07062.1 GDP-L-fucose synthase [Candidatus Methylopumilus planktonicus]QDD08397.1 GDP-L-fucose synthase [Candidatus Methylopumilus planktonicus]QDD09722.1 GDP-L-fucose synthase [Candidatus Methylopumilus planktonicus]
MENAQQKIYVAGHQGMVGSAIVKTLKNKGYKNIVGHSHQELDLTNQLAVNQFFHDEKPDQVYLAAAKVGGIYANNTYPADFIYINLMIESNVIHSAYKYGVKKLLFLGSSCIYPKLSVQPIKEESLLSGHLETTNEPYAIAKIAGIKLCESYNRQYNLDYRSVMPTNLYGLGDNYHSENAHVIPALIRRFHEAKIKKLAFVDIWGSGKPRREFLYVDDMAEASIFVMELNKNIYDTHTKMMQSHLNVGFGSDISILELANIIKQVVGFEGGIKFNSEKPDGAPQKLMDSSLLNHLGWKPKIDLELGLKNTYRDFLMHFA